MPCEKCNSLNRQPSETHPHIDLELDRITTFRGSGFRKCESENYRCRSCGQRFTRDMDKKDHGAIWEFDNTQQ